MSEYKNYTKDDLIQVIEDMDVELFDLTAKVVELINEIGWGDDGTFTFKDGDRWNIFDPVNEETTYE